jgi:hypothetical protein
MGGSDIDLHLSVTTAFEFLLLPGPPQSSPAYQHPPLPLSIDIFDLDTIARAQMKSESPLPAAGGLQAGRRGES